MVPVSIIFGFVEATPLSQNVSYYAFVLDPGEELIYSGGTNFQSEDVCYLKAEPGDAFVGDVVQLSTT